MRCDFTSPWVSQLPKEANGYSDVQNEVALSDPHTPPSGSAADPDDFEFTIGKFLALVVRLFASIRY
jgi:hypothetical protein